MVSIRSRTARSLILLALVLVPSLAWAQAGTATITGLIVDETGGALPGVTVTATNQATNVPYTTVTNEAGNYTIPAVLVGTYVVKAELTGFRTTTIPPVKLESKQVARLDFKMAVGEIAETVEVSGRAPLLQTETATVGEVISGNTVQSLPLNGRNTGQLTLLLPGTMTYNPRGFTNIGSINMNRPFVNGNREQTNNFTVDGLDVNETVDNRVAYQPIPDALAEISVETNNYQADTGNVGGAVVASVIKSGANTFSGNAFWFYRNSDMDANTWENNRSGAPKQERTQDIYGGTIGGPIVKNKLFFFGDYQRSQQDAPGSGLATVAPEAWRRGDLSSFTAAIRDPRTGLPFPGNQIPVERFGPIARALFANTTNYPLPNRGGFTNNYVSDILFMIRANQGDARVDWNLSNNDKVFVRYSFATYFDQRDKQVFPLQLATKNDQPFWNIGGAWNRILGANKFNELLLGYSHTRVTQETYDWAGIGDANATYGIAGGQPIAGLSCIGSVAQCTSGLNGITPFGTVALDTDTVAPTYQIQDKFTWLVGRHTMKFGGQWLHYRQQRFYPGNNGVLGFLTYNGAFTGNAFADFLLDLAAGKGRGGGDPNDPWTQLQNRLSFFAQDDFKVTPNLTLNLGLRWAYTSPLVEQDNRQSNFDLTNGQQLFAQDGSISDRALYDPYYNGWEPRLGAAWKFAERWVARGGYGISQFMEGTGANLRLPMNPPFVYEQSVSYDVTTGAGSGAAGFTDIVPGTKPTGNVRAYDPDLRPQFTQQYNAFVEYQVTPYVSAQVGYVGHHASHLVVPREGNQALAGTGDPSTWPSKTVRRPLYPYQPLITTVAQTASLGESRYNALQASLRQRMFHGLEYLVSYTYGKVRSNSRGFYGIFGGTGPQGVTGATESAYWQNTYDPDADWGPAFHDVRHNFVVSGSWDLPFGKDRKYGADWSGLTNAFLGEWGLSGIFQARSGLPITVFDTSNRSLQNERGGDRPNCVGDWKPADQDLSHWLDINAFQRVPLGTFGNCPVGVARAPGYTNVDMALSKNFRFTGRQYFQFRLEAFNVFNIPSFGPPARDINAPNTFGQITSTVSAPRVIELVFKYYF